MRRITVLILTCVIWCLLSTATYAPAGGVLAAPTLQEEEEEEEPPPAYSEEDLHWLARLVHAEAKGEPLEGKIAVANVVLNRVKSQAFPNTIKQVIFQRINGRYQFCPVRNGTIYQEPSQEAIVAAKLALDGEEVVKEALYFYNPKLARSDWIRSRPIIKVIGNHNFAI